MVLATPPQARTRTEGIHTRMHLLLVALARKLLELTLLLFAHLLLGTKLAGELGMFVYAFVDSRLHHLLLTLWCPAP